MFNFWEVATAAANIAKAGAAVYSSYQQVESAKETAKIQEMELRRQQQVAAATARREARIRTAQLQAGQGRAGVQFSGTQAGVIGLRTTLGTEIQNLASATDHNVGMVKSNERAAVAQGVGQMFLGVSAFAAGGMEFSDALGTKPAGDK